MELKLEQLDFQKRAVQSVIGLFKGQEKNTVENSYFFDIQSNIVNISQNIINRNKKEIISINGIGQEEARLTDDNDYCIEMETGTGKTLVYIITLYELYKIYQLTKFIILVPSIAIKEGVLKTYKIFQKQLYDLYGFSPFVFEYDSKRLINVRHFIQDTHPQIMVVTIQSFASDDRILNQSQRDDSFLGLSYIKAIGKTQPIIIMDEPQEGMDTENSIERIKILNPLFKLRYSATHKVLKNLLFRLTPYDAYQQGLVKKIEVLSVTEKNDEALYKIELTQVQTIPGKNPKVKFNLWMLKDEGFKLKESSWLSQGDNLGEKSGNISYQNFTIDRIYKSLSTGKFHIKFTNDTELIEKQRSVDFSGLFRAQLEWLIRRHFEKQAILNPLGIKCISLVFIDQVKNYISEEGIIKRLFIEEYSKIYLEKTGKDPSVEHITSIQGYYFAKTSNGEYTDNENSMIKNKQIFDLILRDKEELLNISNPVQFIFSHSALGVGWDNPNIFNIATLNQSYSEIKKRQEIGRGLRICVNQNGQRVYDPSDTEEGKELNLLTIIPNETYETFAAQYQEQIKSTYGSVSEASKLRENFKGRAMNKKLLKRNEKLYNSESFKIFWQKLARKTSYTVAFNESSIIEKAVEEVSKIIVNEYQANITLNKIKAIYEDEIREEYIGSEIAKLKAIFTPLDLADELSMNTSISLSATMQIISQLSNLREIVKNPLMFLQKATTIIKRIELEEMFRGLTYQLSDETINIKHFKKEFETYLDTQNTPNRGIYDKIPYESKFEKDFAATADNDSEIICFLKLPDFYKIPTPIGPYTPDFGIVLKKKELKTGGELEYYFVVEVKSTNNINDIKKLTESEIYKIKCAIKHFKTIGLETRFEHDIYLAPVKDYVTDFKNNILR